MKYKEIKLECKKCRHSQIYKETILEELVSFDKNSKPIFTKRKLLDKDINKLRCTICGNKFFKTSYTNYCISRYVFHDRYRYDYSTIK